MRLSKAGIALVAAVVFAQGVVQSVEAKPGFYLSVSEFLETVFAAEEGEASSLIVNSELRAQIEQILGHRFSGLRLKYWQYDDATAWILDEIGKTEPITIGVAVEAGRVASVRVLEYRESRGSEIRFPFFTDQFLGSSMANGTELNESIDGITGATMSVEAAEKVVRIALLLDRQVGSGRNSRERASY